MPVEIFAVPVPSAGTNSVAVCDQVITINKATRILNRVGAMAQSDFKLVENGVKEALGFAVLETLARPHVVSDDLSAGYRAMGQDTAREQEALAWSEALVGDVAQAKL